MEHLEVSGAVRHIYTSICRSAAKVKVNVRQSKISDIWNRHKKAESFQKGKAKFEPL